MDKEARDMPLTGHIREIRRRLVSSLVCVGAAFVFTYAWAEELYAILAKPLFDALPPEARYVVFTGVGEPFFIYLEVGITGAVVLASPVLLYHLWAFTAPGLHANERRWFVTLLTASIFLFSAGVLFAYFVVFPFGFRYLLSFSGSALRPFLSMGLYFSSSLKMLVAFGAIFQLPLLMLALSRIGRVEAKTLIRYWRYAIVFSFIVGAIFTPPDVFSQLLMSVPLVFLYGIGVILSALFGKKKEEGS